MMSLLTQSGLLAQLGPRWDWVHIALLIVGISAIIALVMIALKKFGIAIPDWVMQVFWVLIIAFVVMGAIKLVAGWF